MDSLWRQAVDMPISVLSTLLNQTTPENLTTSAEVIWSRMVVSKANISRAKPRKLVVWKYLPNAFSW